MTETEEGKELLDLNQNNSTDLFLHSNEVDSTTGKRTIQDWASGSTKRSFIKILGFSPFFMAFFVIAALLLVYHRPQST